MTLKTECKRDKIDLLFFYKFSGNPTPNITWYKNKSTPISRTYFQPSYGKWSMTLDELTKADNGNYTCVVCNELDCIEHTVDLHIQGKALSSNFVFRILQLFLIRTI